MPTFKRLVSNEARRFFYGVISDGQIAIDQIIPSQSELIATNSPN
jgi:hypothetical protein